MANFITKAKSPADPWTRLLQATVRDKNLSFRARGVLFRLLSNIDGYRMAVKDLENEGTEGRESISTAMKELRAHRYLITIKTKNDKGQYDGCEHFIFHEPQPKLEDEVEGKIKEKGVKVKASSAKMGSAEAPVGKRFDGFNVDLVNDGQFKKFIVGATHLARLKGLYTVLQNQAGGLEQQIVMYGQIITNSNGRNQIERGNWTAKKWLS
ncbi:MAG: hypothetical protein WCZ98_04025 [Sideroxydans sp.]